MSFGVFESAYNDGVEEGRASEKSRIELKQIVSRCKDQVGDFLKDASTKSDLSSRLQLVESDIRQVVSQFSNEEFMPTVVAEKLFDHYSRKLKTTAGWESDTNFQHYLLDLYGTTDVTDSQVLEALEGYAGVGPRSTEDLVEEEAPEIVSVSKRHSRKKSSPQRRLSTPSAINYLDTNRLVEMSESELRGVYEEVRRDVQDLSSQEQLLLGDEEQLEFQIEQLLSKISQLDTTIDYTLQDLMNQDILLEDVVDSQSGFVDENELLIQSLQEEVDTRMEQLKSTQSRREEVTQQAEDGSYLLKEIETALQNLGATASRRRRLR